MAMDHWTSGTSTTTSAEQLLADLAGLRIRIEAHGERLRYSPQSVVTPELTERMKAHKTAILAILRQAPDTLQFGTLEATAVRQAATRQLEGDKLFPTELSKLPSSANVRWVDNSIISNALDCIPLKDLRACPKCETFEMWQSVAGDPFGNTPGRWRCTKCDPPADTKELAEDAERFRRQAK
ncbi:MAG: hypothetical protein P8R31_02345 [Mariniblastus sp.]|nr:hypothetical protein [Mariniblastus sp.]